MCGYGCCGLELIGSGFERFVLVSDGFVFRFSGAECLTLFCGGLHVERFRFSGCGFGFLGGWGRDMPFIVIFFTYF